MDRRAFWEVVPDVLKCRRFDELPDVAFVPRPARVDLALVAFSRRNR